jgi:glutamine synthetase
VAHHSFGTQFRVEPFFIFDDVRYDQNQHEGYYHVDSIEGEWNRGRKEGPNLGSKLRYKEGYFPVPPADQLMDIRNEMMQTLIDSGVDVEAQHHEVATGGQCEIDMKFQPLVRMAGGKSWLKITGLARRK